MSKATTHELERKIDALRKQTVLVCQRESKIERARADIHAQWVDPVADSIGEYVTRLQGLRLKPAAGIKDKVFLTIQRSVDDFGQKYELYADASLSNQQPTALYGICKITVRYLVPPVPGTVIDFVTYDESGRQLTSKTFSASEVIDVLHAVVDAVAQFIMK